MAALFLLTGCRIDTSPRIFPFALNLVSNTTQPTPSKGALVVGAISGDTNGFGTTATFTVRLDSAPTAAVSVCLNSSDTTNGGSILSSGNVQAAAAPCNLQFLSFTSSNWQTNQTVTVQGAIGATADTNYSITVSVNSTDTRFQDLTNVTVSARNRTVIIPGSYFVRVNMINLNGSITLQNNGSDNLTLTSSGLNNFSQSITNGGSYSVAILTQPTSQVCSISGLSFGTSSSNVILDFNCVSGYIFNGTIFGTATPPTLNQNLTTLTTLAGNGSTGMANGIGSLATFSQPIAIATDGLNIYVADIFNNLIRTLNLGNNAVTTLASISNPHGIATDGTNVFVSSFSHTVNKIPISTGAVSVLGGITATSGTTDGGTGVSRFNVPTYLTTDGTNLFVTDRGNNRIRRIVIATGISSTVVNTGLNLPNGIATDGNFLYIANSGDHTILRVDLSLAYPITPVLIAGIASTAGTADNATGTSATFNIPYGVALDGTYLYVLDGGTQRIRRVTLSGAFPVATLSIANGSGGLVDGSLGVLPGPGVASFCNLNPACNTSLTTDGNYLFLADRFNNAIRRFQ